MNYLQRIQISDVFVILDNVQHQRRAFEHRNKIKAPNGKGAWCSIPLKKNSSRPVISELMISDIGWIDKHKALIDSYYKKAKYYDRDILNYIYSNINSTNFVDSIYSMTINLCETLDIEYNFAKASELDLTSKNDKMLYDITKVLEGNEYISGPNGRDYINKILFNDVKLTYHEFDFPKYSQLYGEFIPWMSIIDQIFNIGIKETKKCIHQKPILKDI